MFVANCDKCGDTIYSSDELVTQDGSNFHYECTPHGYFDTHNTEEEE
jgi:uncharacterized Zn finger protein